MILFGAVLLLTLLLYLVLVVNLTTMNQSDPAGNSLSQAAAVLMAIGLWILLAGLALWAGLKAQLPARLIIAVLVLIAASGAAALAAIQLLSDSLYRARWPILVPVLAPLLIIGFSLWAWFPGLRPSFPGGRAGSLAGTALLLLSVAPWPALVYRSRHRAADEKDHVVGRMERERRENREAFNRLTHDSHISEWLAFRLPENELRDRALEGIRHLPRRQADAEELMGRGQDWFWEEVPLLDLQASPVVCDRGRHFLQERARDVRPPDPETPPRFGLMSERVDRYFATFQWLVGQGCDCDAELAAVEASLRIYPDSPERNQVLAELDRIRQLR